MEDMGLCKANTLHHAACSVRKGGQNGFWFGLEIQYEIHLSLGACAPTLLLFVFPEQHQ